MNTNERQNSIGCRAFDSVDYEDGHRTFVGAQPET